MMAAESDRPTIDGHIAAGIDRLPLTRAQWQLAILVEVTCGFIIVDTDGIGARLYPFVWRPNHLNTVLQYSVILALDRRPIRPPAGNSHVHRPIPPVVRSPLARAFPRSEACERLRHRLAASALCRRRASQARTPLASRS